MKKVVSWFQVLKDLPLLSEDEPGTAPAAAEAPVLKGPVKEAKATEKAAGNEEITEKKKAKNPAAKKS